MTELVDLKACLPIFDRVNRRCWGCDGDRVIDGRRHCSEFPGCNPYDLSPCDGGYRISNYEEVSRRHLIEPDNLCKIHHAIIFRYHCE